MTPRQLFTHLFTAKRKDGTFLFPPPVRTDRRISTADVLADRYSTCAACPHVATVTLTWPGRTTFKFCLPCLSKLTP